MTFTSPSVPPAPPLPPAAPAPPTAPMPPPLPVGRFVVRSRAARSALLRSLPWRFWRCWSSPKWSWLSSFLASTVLHAAMFVALALISIPSKPAVVATTRLETSVAEAQPVGVDDQSFAPGPAQMETILPAEETLPDESAAAGLFGSEPDLSVAPGGQGDGSAGIASRDALSSEPGLKWISPNESHGAGDLMGLFPGAKRGGLEGRTPAGRQALTYRRGGTDESEKAVDLGLAWLARHQRGDGSWHFDHRDDEKCRGYCRNPGSFASTTAATGLALLPFLGRGHTHLSGKYHQTVQKALYYLGERMMVTEHGGDLQEGTMYSQGIATIALCEAYAMSKDAALKPYAQSAIDFIVSAQDPKGGGWRYTPGQPGDTTVFGWQLMALKSGQLAGLRVPSPTIALAQRYLDSVQSEYGSEYGYQTPVKGKATTAIGLLCRMYTGWDRGRQGIAMGVSRLSKLGPQNQSMYFNYYATLVLSHYGGAEWKKWNGVMRDRLIASQSHVGHETGSWYFADEHGEIGGRLYLTAMAIMTLEVYYRYLPLYGEKAVGRF